MFRPCRKQSKRVFAVLVAAILLVSLFFAAFLIAENLDHDCKGEHCPVCECLQLCEAILHQTGIGWIPVICVILAIAAAIEAGLDLRAAFVPRDLITLKIRLNI